MSKRKFIRPIPENPEEMIERIIALEEAAMIHRQRKAEAMARYRDKLKKRLVGKKSKRPEGSQAPSE